MTTLAAFQASGFASIEGVLSQAACDEISTLLMQLAPGSAGTRNLLAEPWCQQLATAVRAHPDLDQLIPTRHVAVQCTYFAKSTLSNWRVAAHQDLSIPVACHIPEPELSGWSIKEGQQYVHAPLSLLQELVAVRLHVDPCGPDDGPLKVVPGSHRHGLIDDQDVPRLREHLGQAVCVADRGTALALSPLLLHASSKATGSSQRRVLHFLFGPGPLPHGLAWAKVPGVVHTDQLMEALERFDPQTRISRKQPVEQNRAALRR
jgi:hypothetical protein